MKFLAEVFKIEDETEWTIEVETPTQKDAHDYLEGEYVVMTMADASTHHVCKYCGSIVKGTDKDILCDGCRETFGHVFYSEL